MTVTTDQVDSIVQLPTQCRAGYVVKVANTESEDDDYAWPGLFSEKYRQRIRNYAVRDI